MSFFFFFNDTATTEIYTLSLHDALPISHPYAEVVTVMSGSYGNNFGEKFEPRGEMMKPGSLFVLPAKHAHYTWTADEETILQVQFMGPAGIDFFDPADDPRKK